MNQQTLAYIYQKYEPQEYFRNYFEHKQRPDGRQFSQSRSIKFTVQKNKVALSQGENIITSQYVRKIQPVPFTGYSENIQKLKINIRFSGSNNTSKRQSWLQKCISQRMRNNQLFYHEYFFNNQKTKQCYIQTGQINVKIFGQDGVLEEAILLCLSMLCWVSVIPIQPKYNQSNVNEEFAEIGQFLFPIKYCEVYSQIVVDPTSKQQQHCTLEVSFIHNLLRQGQSPIVIFKTHQNALNQSQAIQAMGKLSQQHLSKIVIDLKQIREKLREGNETINLIICDLE